MASVDGFLHGQYDAYSMVLDYAIYGWDDAFDVTHEVTISSTSPSGTN